MYLKYVWHWLPVLYLCYRSKNTFAVHLAPNSKGNNGCSFTGSLRLPAGGTGNGGARGQPIEQVLDGTGILISCSAIHREATFQCTANNSEKISVFAYKMPTPLSEASAGDNKQAVYYYTVLQLQESNSVYIIED